MGNLKTIEEKAALMVDIKADFAKGVNLRVFFLINKESADTGESIEEKVRKHRSLKLAEDSEEDFKLIYNRELIKEHVPEDFVSHQYFKLNLIVRVKDLLRIYISQRSQDHDLIYITNQFLSYLGVPISDLNPNNKQVEIQEKDRTVKLIVFDSDRTIKNVFDLLASHFSEYETALLLILNGDHIDDPLIFHGAQNMLVEFFARLKNNNFILSSKTQINTWLCKNFRYYYFKGEVKEQRNLSPSSVKDILSGKQHVSEKSIIFKADWLPL